MYNKVCILYYFLNILYVLKYRKIYEVFISRKFMEITIPENKRLMCLGELVDKFRGVVQRINKDENHALCILYDLKNEPIGRINLPHIYFGRGAIPFQGGSVFDFEVRKLGCFEEFYVRYIPGAQLTPEEMADDDKRIEEALEWD